MSKLVVAVLASLITTSVVAQNNAVKMTKEELLSFLPGTKVTHVASSSGSLRNWTNEPDGKFVASTNNKKFGSAMGTTAGSAGQGSWKVNDEGKYCVDIAWKRVQESWCASVLKGADGVYYLGVADDSHKIEFAK